MPRKRRSPIVFLACVFAAVVAPRLAQAASAPGGFDPLPLLAALVLVLVGARAGGELFQRLGQSPVLGELIAGVLLGNLGLLGIHSLDGMNDQIVLTALAEIGVLFLLFQVGLESDIERMLAVGASSALVAVLGVIAPLLLGYWVSSAMAPGHPTLSYWFVGATLCATSVGITARVLADLGKTSSVEGRIILGAAVIDDVLALVVLAVVSGLIQAADQGRAFDPLAIAWIVGKAALFLGGAVIAGRWLSKRVFQTAAGFQGEGWMLTLALAFCFGLSWLAGVAGLAPIVGAFAAGLVLDEAHWADLSARPQETQSMHELLQPLSAFLVPVFFVLMGMRVDLSVFGRGEVLGFAAALTVVAIVTKQVCSLGVLDRGADRLAVGLGMIPRGEVGLIFASIGSGLMLNGVRVVDDAVFSAVVVMVAVTTIVTPPLLVARLKRKPG